MSKIIYICFNDATDVDFSKKDIERIAKRIIPDNLSLLETQLFETEGILYGVINPSNNISIRGKSVLLGQVFEKVESWDKPGTMAPDGSFAIIRANASTVELLTDVVASRTTWYFKNERVFISSSSQRAIIMLLRSFEFNMDVLPWMMSTGSLGPYNSWDRRIKTVPPDSIVSLDRKKWHISTQSKSAKFSTAVLSEQVHLDRLKKSFTDTFQSIDLEFDKWILSLSGGYDSRSILCFLDAVGRNFKDLSSFTLGLQRSIYDKDNDAFLAQKVADHFNMANTYFPTDLVGRTEEILNRFLICGEGRIDHLSAYMDGFESWKSLFEANIGGIIKGDESLGWKSVLSEKQLRARLGMGLCTDYTNLECYREFGFVDQQLPVALLQKEDESLDQWRDRLYQQFRIPVILAALTDLKLNYVEVVNPLLSRKIIYTIRQVPDKLRRNKSLFKKIVDDIGPPIPFAKKSAIANRAVLLRSPSLAKLFQEEINSIEAEKLFHKDFLKPILNDISKNRMNNTNYSLLLKKALSKLLSERILKKLVKSSPKSAIDNHVLAFRIYLVIKMKRLLEEDSKVLKSRTISS